MKRLRVIGAAALSLLSLASGCDWRKLDEAVENAPVLSLGAPANYDQEDVGRLLLPLAPAPGVAGRFMFFSTVQPNAAMVDFDDTGKATSANVPGTSLTLFGSRPVRAAHAMAGQARVFLGVPDFKVDASVAVPLYTGSVFQMSIDPGPTFVVTPFAGPRTDRPQELQFGLGMASGKLGVGSPEFDDLVVVSSRYVSIFPDGLASTRIASEEGGCNIESGPSNDGRLMINRAVLVGDFLPGLAGPQEIVVGVPRAAVLAQTAGKVLIMQPQPENPLSPVSCTVQIQAPASPTPYLGAANFGNVLAMGDFSGPAGAPDGVLDLVVGAPPDRVFVYLGPLVAPVPPEVNLVQAPQVVLAPPPGVQGTFGTRVLAMNYDGQPGDELVVSVPDAAAGGVTLAGQVLVYKIGAPGAEAGIIANIQKVSPDSGVELGIGLASLPFQAAGCGKAANLLLAGGVSEVLTYFRAPMAFPDPRCLPPPGM